MLCEQLPELEVVKAFDNPHTFLKELDSLDFDLCIMDIEMPGINGLQVANLLHGKPVIFTTAYKDYAAEAFDLNAIDYIRKPVKKERLQQAIQKVFNQIPVKTKAKFFHINSDKGKALIFFDQLLYITVSETDSRDKVAHLAENATLVVKNVSFEKLLSLLPATEFVQVNKKEIIALKAVQAFSFDEITTTLSLGSGKSLKLVLSEIYRTEFLEKVRV